MIETRGTAVIGGTRVTTTTETGALAVTFAQCNGGTRDLAICEAITRYARETYEAYINELSALLQHGVERTDGTLSIGTTAPAPGSDGAPADVEEYGRDIGRLLARDVARAAAQVALDRARPGSDLRVIHLADLEDELDGAPLPELLPLLGLAVAVSGCGAGREIVTEDDEAEGAPRRIAALAIPRIAFDLRLQRTARGFAFRVVG